MQAADTVVIGAGLGGLAAAIRLAAAGQRVLVLERNAAVGGKMSELRAEGFRFDTGPSVITMRAVLEDLFAAAGQSMQDHLELLPVEPIMQTLLRKPAETEVIITGRCKNPPAYFDLASVHSEMVCHKHYAERGVDLKRGVDY